MLKEVSVPNGNYTIWQLGSTGKKEEKPEMVIMWAYVICNFLVSIKDDSLKQKLQHHCQVYKVY